MGITIGMYSGHPRNRGLIPGSFTKFCLNVSVQTDVLSHPASYPVRIGGCFLGLNRPRHESKYLPTNHAKTKMNGAVTQLPYTPSRFAREVIYL